MVSNLKSKYLGLFKAIISPFVPQQAILAHKACGWFVTHGGANGIMEALTQGVPM
jgi:UDP:flavonoid glycosyltransferase YjiC (YdhE family)